MDVKELKESVDIVSVVMADESVNLRKRGSHWIGHCPFHNDKHPSMNVYSSGRYKCFACGASGDVINYVRERKGLSFEEAKEFLVGDNAFERVERYVEADVVSHAVVMPVPSLFTPPSFMHYRHGMPRKVWQYRGMGGVLGYTCRFEWFDNEKGKLMKDVLPYCVVDRWGWMRWEYKGFKTSYGIPLYGLDMLEADVSRSKTVIVVEGEKVADALQGVLPHVIVVSWAGGANRVDGADWSPLRGWRGEVIGFPDNDWQGWSAMTHVSKVLGVDMRMIKAPNDAPKGWDFADCDWGIAETRLWCSENMVRVHSENGRYDFGAGGLVPTEFGWKLQVWKNN